MSAPRYARLASVVLAQVNRAPPPPPDPEDRAAAIAAVAREIALRARKRRLRRWVASASRLPRSRRPRRCGSRLRCTRAPVAVAPAMPCSGGADHRPSGRRRIQASWSRVRKGRSTPSARSRRAAASSHRRTVERCSRSPRAERHASRGCRLDRRRGRNGSGPSARLRLRRPPRREARSRREVPRRYVRQPSRGSRHEILACPSSPPSWPAVPERERASR